MKFRPCIDIHDGKVKQIVGGALSDNSSGETNFVSETDASFYSDMYRSRNLSGGHIILLNKAGTPEYEADLEEARLALRTYPNGFMIGGGITAENAEAFLDMGASHVIVTSYVFRDGAIDMERLNKLKDAVGREHLVLDLSCRRKDDDYYIVTDRWQKYTDVKVNASTLDSLAEYCDEYLIHAVDVEGRKSGCDIDLLKLLGEWTGLPVTYAGGVSSFEDLTLVKELGRNHIDVTIGSALSLFGGDMELDEVLKFMNL
jgi:phosphoribosylformimino-5-aminoimidazole carboxamide ribotide isomerase, eukaryotic type